MTLASDWETTTPLEAGVNALEWARQAELIHQQERQGVNPDAVSHRVPGAAQATRSGPRVAPNLSPTSVGTKPLGPLAGDGFYARVAREHGHTPVVVLVPFRALPVGGWAGYGARGQWEPESQPTTPLLYPSAYGLDLSDPPTTPGRRPFSVGLIDKPETAPATPRGTEALTVATHTARTLSRYLTEYAAISPVGEKRRYDAESDAYADYARSAENAITRTLSWLDALELQLEPVPPFAPITVPAQLRGYIVTSPI